MTKETISELEDRSIMIPSEHREGAESQGMNSLRNLRDHNKMSNIHSTGIPEEAIRQKKI